MHDEPTFGSQVRQGPPPRASRRARRWPRLLVFAFLAVLMLVVLGGTSRASELDPNETVTDALDPVVETVTDTVDPVGRDGHRHRRPDGRDRQPTPSTPSSGP